MFLELENGQIERDNKLDPGGFSHSQFKTYMFSVSMQMAPGAKSQSWREYTSRELQEELRARRGTALPAGPVAAEINLRTSIAFAPLALTMLGIPLGMILERGGRGIGFGASMVVVFLYYLLLILGLNLAEKEALPAVPALWAANAITGAIGAAIFKIRLSK
jgi:lipopolysaccharide export LptBFGC system permease protein LptF